VLFENRILQGRLINQKVKTPASNRFGFKRAEMKTHAEKQIESLSKV
jgi:hypothetical protein